MGADKVEERLRPLLRAVRDAGHPVVWACDPMHGNTFTAPGGARPATSTPSSREIAGFVRAHRAEGTWPGGIHVELTGDNVTECLGGADEMLDATSTTATRPSATRASTAARASTSRSSSPS